MNCSFHHEREATEFCVECLVPMCPVCSQYEHKYNYCIQCYAPRVRQKQRNRGIVLSVLLVATIVGAVAFYSSLSELNRQKRMYGSHAEEILRLKEILTTDSCNLSAGRQALTLLMESSNHSEASALADHFAHNCPTTIEALISLFFVQQRSLDHRGALETAEEVIRFAPHRPEGYAYRAIAREAAGSLDAAAQDFQKALSLNPRLLDVPMNLANVLERIRKPCDAAGALEHALTFYPGLENRFELERRIERLRRHGDCRTTIMDEDTVEIQFDMTQEVVMLQGHINGEHPARFILDTGASSVVITDELASRVGASTQFENIPVFVQTAGGVVDAYPSKLAQVAIGGAQVQDLPVLVCETMGNDVDGLLGANFLRRFQVAIDHESGKILFRNIT